MFLLDQPFLFTRFLFFVTLLVVEVGYRLSVRRAVNEEAPIHEQIVNARDALRLLLSLLLGFTLAMALPRFDQRRQMIVDEANSIGATYLRAQLLPAEEKGRVLGLLKEYVGVRRRSAELRLDTVEYQSLVKRTRELQSELWEQAVSAGQKAPSPITGLFVSSLNETITLAEKRRASVENRVQVSVWIMLFLIALLTSFATGYSSRRRIWLAFLTTPIMVAIVMGMTADMDSPRSGLIRTDVRSLERVEEQLKSSPVTSTEPLAPAGISTPSK